MTKSRIWSPLNLMEQGNNERIRLVGVISSSKEQGVSPRLIGTSTDDSEPPRSSPQNAESQELTGEPSPGSVPDNSGRLATEVGNFQATLGPTFQVDLSSLRRRRVLKGIPEHADLVSLATVYLTTQRELWPELQSETWLPAPSDFAAEVLALEYRQRVTKAVVNMFSATNMGRRTAWAGIGAAYLRYSSLQSNEKSLDDQLSNILRVARREQRFIPWSSVFCDSAVSGTLACRRGYKLLKGLLENYSGLNPPDTVYVDDFTRASRDVIESHRLVRLLKSLRKRLIGASDGFDLDSSQAGLLVGAISLASELLITSTKQKCGRGLRGAARRGTSTGRPPLGYTVEPIVDQNGRIMTSSKGQPLKRWIIDPETAKYVVMAFQMLGVEKRSYSYIRNKFNALQVAGRNCWATSVIRNICANATYIGVAIYGRHQHVVDPDTEKVVHTIRPRSEWQIERRPEWRIVSDDLWRAARRQAAAIRAASPLCGPNPNRARSQFYPTSLLSGTLMCGYCGTPLTLARSSVASSSRYFWCNNGHLHIRNCPLSCKSAKIIENALMNYLQEKIFDDEAIHDLVLRANEWLVKERAKPRPDETQLQSKIAELKDRLAAWAEAIADHPPQFIKTILAKVDAGERELRSLTRELREIQQAHSKLGCTISCDDVKRAVADLPALLNRDVHLAAPAVRALTGPISVYLKEVPGRPAPCWVAEFEADLYRGIRYSKVNESRLAQKDQAEPEAPLPDGWGHVTVWGWNMPQKHVVVIDRPVPKHQKYAKQVEAIVDAGGSYYQAAIEVGISPSTAGTAYRYAKTGQDRSAQDKAPYTFKRNRRPPRHVQLAPAVMDLREKGLSFEDISQQLGVQLEVVYKAHRHVAGPVQKGRPRTHPERHRHPQPPARYQKFAPRVVEIVDGGGTLVQAAQELGISDSLASLAYMFGKTGLTEAEQQANPDKIRALRRKPLYQQHAEQVAQIVESGGTVADAARQLGLSHSVAMAAYRYAKTGETDREQRRLSKDERYGGRRARYREIAPEVVRLKDQGFSLARIAQDMGVSRDIVGYAYRSLRGPLRSGSQRRTG